MGNRQMLGNPSAKLDPYSPYPEPGTRRLQPDREYHEYSDVSLAQTWAGGRVRIRNSGQQSESWSVVTKRNDDTHAISEVRNGAYCKPYFHTGAYRGRRPSADPDYWMIEIQTAPGIPWERAARADTLEEALTIARHIAGKIFGDGRADTVSRHVAEMQRVNAPTWHQPEVNTPEPKQKPRTTDKEIRYGKMELVTSKTSAPKRGRNSKVTTRRLA